jgi:hypothetical protein
MPVIPQPQSVGRCAELRETCQGKIFEKMDALHHIQMMKMSEIQEEIAYQKGCSNGRQSSKEASPWRDAFIKALFTWGPPLLFLVLIGGITLLKSKGWL